MRSMMYGIQIRPVSVVVKTRYSSSVFITSSLSCHDDALRTALPPRKTRWITKRHLPGPVTRSMQIERVALQGFDGDVFEDVFVGGFEDDLRRHAGLVGLDPAQHVQAPAVPGLQALEAHFRARRAEVVAARAAEIEKLLGHLDAHQVRDAFRAVRGAATVAEKAGERCIAAREQRAAENVLFLGEDGAHKGQTRTGRPRARNSGAAIFCMRTTARTFSAKGSAASMCRRSSLAANSLAISVVSLSIRSTSPQVDAASTLRPDSPYPALPAREECALARGPCPGRFASRWPRDVLRAARAWAFYRRLSPAPGQGPLPTAHYRRAGTAPARLQS